MNQQRLHFAMPLPVPPGLWRRVPPAIFPPVLGMLGLTLAWLGGVGAFSLPPALAQIAAGMAVPVAVFALVAYAGKLLRRPAVVAEDLSILPGRAGVAAAVLAIYLLAVLAGTVIAPAAGKAVLLVGAVLHGAMLAVLLRVLWRGAAEQRRVTVVWHLAFTGIIVAARAAVAVGWPTLAEWLLWPAALAALAIYAATLRHVLRMPAALRPLLAVHVAPLALFGTVFIGLGWTAAGSAFGWMALGALLLLAVGARWLLAGGFSPLWGALTFPIAATAGLWTAIWQSAPTELHRIIAGVLLVAATMIVVPILFAVLRVWAQGRLAVKTNAAIA